MSNEYGDGYDTPDHEEESFDVLQERMAIWRTTYFSTLDKLLCQPFLASGSVGDVRLVNDAALMAAKSAVDSYTALFCVTVDDDD